MTPFKKLVALVACLAGPAAAAAQTPRDPMAPIVAEAIRNNLGLAQETLDLERADAGVREARGRLLPSLTLDSRYSEQSGTLNLGDFVNPAYAALNRVTGTTDFPTNLDVTLPQRHESRLRLLQPVFNPTVLAAHALARHARNAKAFERGASARQLAADVQAAYVQLASARAARRTWESTLGLVRESERVAERLVAAGRATPDAVLRAHADRGDVEQQLAEATQVEHAASREVNQMLRRPLDAPVERLGDTLAPPDLGLGEDEAVGHALGHREELAQADAGVQTAGAGVRLASASLLPTVSLALDYGFQGRELAFDRRHDFAVASVVLSWNLFSGGSDFARRQGARADAERLRLRRQELEDLVRLDVQQAYEAAAVARDAIGTAESRLAAAERSFALVRRRWEEGLASQVEFLDARTAFTTADLNRVQTVYRYAARYVELERAAAVRRLDQ